MSKQSEIMFIYQRLRLKSDIFQTAPGTDDDVATTTGIFGFYGHFSFCFLSIIKNKWKFTHTNFLVQRMKITRDITQLHELSEQPTYILAKSSNRPLTFYGFSSKQKNNLKFLLHRCNTFKKTDTSSTKSSENIYKIFQTGRSVFQ